MVLRRLETMAGRLCVHAFARVMDYVMVVVLLVSTEIVAGSREPFRDVIAFPLQPIPYEVELPNGEQIQSPMAMVTEAVMFRENSKSEYRPHLMYLYKLYHGATAYLEVAVYDVSYMGGQTWHLLEREVDLSKALDARCSSSSFSLMPSIAVSPSRHQVIMHGWGPGECGELLLMYDSDRNTRVIRAQQKQRNPPIGELGTALVTISAPSAGRGNYMYRSSPFYLVSFGGCAWHGYQPETRKCSNYSDGLHQVLVRVTEEQDDDGVAQWEHIQLNETQKPESRVFARLFADGNASLVLFGGWKPLGRWNGIAILDVWRFDLSSRMWIDLGAVFLKRWEAYNTKRGPDSLDIMASYQASRRTLVIYDNFRRNGCLAIVCYLWEASASCARASVRSSSLFFSGLCWVNLASGTSSFYFVSSLGREISSVRIYITITRNRTVQRLEHHDLGFAKGFPGFKGSSRREVAALQQPMTSSENREYVFFGVGGLSRRESRPIRDFIAENNASMPVWILRYSNPRRSGTLSSFEYTLLYPKPGPKDPLRHYASVTFVTNNTAVLYGGYIRSSARSAEPDPNPTCFNLQRHFWTRADIAAGVVPSLRREHVSFRHNSSVMVVHGGIAPWDDVLGDLWMLVMDDEPRCKVRWHNLTPHVKKGRLPQNFGHSATHTDNAVILYGGRKPSPSKLTFVRIQSSTWVSVSDILISPSIPNRYYHSLSFFNADLILLGGSQADGDRNQPQADWALLMSFKRAGTSMIATSTRFFKADIVSQLVFGDMVLSGYGTHSNVMLESHFSILNTTGLCPIGH
eukprot:scpid46298/ scgid8566/ 